ncbi:MAG: UDP-3-O-(3-hydroxymyristoyl)glucosamine N-acyltransferase [Hyphomonadaceae bacterium]|nr:UDP-3-O-(3-hydroxymyristoyl)glucosamine N-acyltransferase [Hyphomonadaceae bacterium]
MIDPRFYEALGPMTVRALAPSAEIGGEADHLLTGAAPADRAGPNDLCYFEASGRNPVALSAAPGACVISPGQAHLAPNAAALILSERPRFTFSALVSKLARPRGFGGGAHIHLSAKIEEGAVIGPGVVIAEGAAIGAGAQIGPNAVIGPGVQIGRRSRIGANSTILFALIGDDVTILAGAVIGEQGFGVASDSAGMLDVPHLGRVIIQDRATIGANTTIDRGMFDDTVIGEDAKIDNLCQIAHNVQIGRGAQIAAFAGVSGSTVVGDRVIMGGRVGIGDHRSIGAGAVLAGGSAVFKDVPAGETWTGYPAKPIRQWMREHAWLARKVGSRNAGE